VNDHENMDDDRELGPEVDAPDDVRRALDVPRADLGALTDDVRDLTDAVSGPADHLLTSGSVGIGGLGGCAPWCWQKLDEEAAAKLRRDLADWVGWLRGRYPIAEQLPACWSQHSELVEELTALHAVWNAAHLDVGAHPSGAADFHDRWLPGMLGRIRTWGVHCTTEHRERAGGVYGPGVVDVGAFPVSAGQS